MLALAATGLVFLTIRSQCSTTSVGSFTAEASQELTAGQRALTMLRVVPEWVRLLAWPAHLQADYSPQEITGAPGWSLRRPSVLFIAAFAVAALAARRTTPVVTFGLIWVAIAIFPVSNVLVPRESCWRSVRSTAESRLPPRVRSLLPAVFHRGAAARRSAPPPWRR